MVLVADFGGGEERIYGCWVHVGRHSAKKLIIKLAW